ncbi:hypothetical protein [Streptomyces sp. SID5770]|uniref:hypothetical protein n=1 Tax=unclassified Streptomyces TaxID=2593676 RepID=UPI001370AA75|nr:hypothetical protein [Streptomyces sp. SID5770]MZE52989.1 hypothetical protein [Streptomyces sp. SID5770]
MDGAPFWWVIVALLLGIASTHLSAFVDTRSKRGERHAITREDLVRRREEFELQHLVEVNQLLRALRERQSEFVSAKWPHPRLGLGGDEVRQRTDAALRELRNADEALSAQVGFILDDDVRALVRKAADVIGDRVYTLNQVDSTASFEEKLRSGDLMVGPYTMIDEEFRAVEAAYEAISARVRSLYVRGAGM